MQPHEAKMEPHEAKMEPHEATVTNPAGEDAPKNHYFETETKRLKDYYLAHPHHILNRRILFSNDAATVRFFGPLVGKSQDELWVGVEWDEVGRGKHDGTVQGHRYFQCADRKGSMVKYDKIEFGYKLQTALFKRYFRSEELQNAKSIYDSMQELKKHQKGNVGNVGDVGNVGEQIGRCHEQSGTENESSGEAAMETKRLEEVIEKKKVHKVEYDAEAYIQTIKKSKRIMIEFVGFDEIWSKINNLDKLQSISLAECRICDLGPLGNLNSLLQNLKILSLQDNLLSHWDQVVQLGYELPQLMELSLTNNQIAPPTQTYELMGHYSVVGSEVKAVVSDSDPFKQLKCLILINTGLNWASLMKLLPLFSRVEQLLICRNDMSDTHNIDSERLVTYLQEVRFINVEETKTGVFDGLVPLGRLPVLQKLILNKNPLERFGRGIKGFESLRHLSVQYCAIDKPVVLYEIFSFAARLESLNVKHNPVGDKMGNGYVRMRAVAELPKLTTINGAALKKYQRKDCEIYYMRESFREYFALRKVPDYDYDFEDFLKYCQDLHPNVPLLINRYGNPYEVEKKTEIQEIIKEEVRVVEAKKGTGMVDVLLEYKDTGLIEKKKVPLSWTLSSLKNFFSKTIKIPVNLQKLMCYVQALSSGEQMTEDHKTLSYYNLKTGSKITIEQTKP